MNEMYNHLLERGIQDFHGVCFSDTHATFLIYDLLERVVGYQRYNPSGLKTHSKTVSNNDKKYYTYYSKIFHCGHKAGLWGCNITIRVKILSS